MAIECRERSALAAPAFAVPILKDASGYATLPLSAAKRDRRLDAGKRPHQLLAGASDRVGRPIWASCAAYMLSPRASAKT